MNSELWERLRAFDFDEAGVAFCFSERLARENGWSRDFAQRVVDEYRRFLYLCMEAGHPVTPSDEVDQAWHLHLCYTRSYWEELCDVVLGRKIHHGPTKGGAKEGEKFRDWYERTLESYQIHFGEMPPEDVWPSVAARFRKQSFKRVDLGTAWVLPKQMVKTVASVLLLASILVGCDEGDGSNFIVIGVVGLIVVFVIWLISGGGGGPRRGGRGRKRRDDGSGCGYFFGCGTGCSSDHDGGSGCGSSGCGSSGCGGGGCGGGGD